MTCKDCYHNGACTKNKLHKELFGKEINVEECSYFKDKTKIIELPCKINDILYIIPTDNNGFRNVTRLECLGFEVSAPEPVANLFQKENGKSNRLYQASFDMFGTIAIYILANRKGKK